MYGEENTDGIIDTQGIRGGSALKNLPAMQETQETWVRSPSQEAPLEEEMETCSSILTVMLS